MSAAQQEQVRPLFRSGVELVLVEATVLDKDGRPILDLAPGDFSITVAGKRRPVVASQYVRSGPSAGAVAALPGPPASNDLTRPAPIDLSAAFPTTDERSIVVAVDVENIRSGEGRIAMQNLADYFDTLPAGDKIGVVLLPIGSAQLELTTDRARIRSILSRTVGSSGQLRSCDPTSGEAAAHSAGDERGYVSYEDRVRNMGCPYSRPIMESHIPRYRAQTRRVLQILTDIASALSTRPGRRAITLVSEGLFGDEETRRDLSNFAAQLERHRVVLFGIHLAFPMAEASAKTVKSDTRLLDDRYGFDAMAETSVAGGGETIRAISRATAAVTRIDAALSGSYILAFERSDSDKDGRRLSLKIQTNRKGAEVRARTQVTISPTK